MTAVLDTVKLRLVTDVPVVEVCDSSLCSNGHEPYKGFACS